MMNIRICLFLFCAGFSMTTQAQSASEILLRENFEDYFKAVESQDIEKSLDYIYPKLYEVVPREQLAAAMQELYANPDMAVKLENSKLGDIDPIQTEEGIHFTKLDYSFRMIMNFKTPEEEEGEEDEDFGAFMLEMFKAQFGEENVKSGATKEEVIINLENVMIAFLDPAYGDQWKFLEKKENLLPMIKDMIPKNIWKYISK